jgi:hypothetical protein
MNKSGTILTILAVFTVLLLVIQFLRGKPRHMFHYLFRFKIETCLTYTTDLSFNVDTQQVLLLYSKRNPNDKYVLAELMVDAKSAADAWNKCSTVLPKLLDSLSLLEHLSF